MLWNLPKQKEMLFLKDQEATARQSTETWSVTQMDRNFSRYCLVRCVRMVKCGVVHSCEAAAFWFSLLACRACGRMWQLGIKETKHSSWVMLSRSFWRMCASTSIKIRSLPVRGFPALLHCLEAVNVSGQACPSSAAADNNRDYSLSHKTELAK